MSPLMCLYTVNNTDSRYFFARSAPICIADLHLMIHCFADIVQHTAAFGQFHGQLMP